MKSWSFTEILRILSFAGAEKAVTTPITEENNPVSIRLKLDTRHFLRMQAEALDLPLQRVIGLALDGIAQASSISVRDKSMTPVLLLRDLIKAHRLSDVDALSFLPGVTLDAWADDVLLQKHINKEFIEQVAKVFYVDPTWLKTGKSPIYNSVRWYKNIAAVVDYTLTRHPDRRLTRLIMTKRTGVDLSAIGDSDRSKQEFVTLIAEFEVVAPDHNKVITYQPMESMEWTYWRGREHIKMVAAFTEVLGGRVRLDGLILPSDAHKRLVDGQNIIASELKRRIPGLWFPSHLLPNSGNYQWSDENEWRGVESAINRHRQNGSI
jgi:hypothetical protein